MEVLEHYCTEEGQDQLARSLQLTDLVRDVKVVANEIAKKVELKSWEPGEILIVQDADDDDIHFILSGQVRVLVNEHEVALVGAGGHVGELALIDPRSYRCASVVATRKTVSARLAQSDFVEVANRHPELWRRTAQVLGDRLREQNRFARLPNPRPAVFLGFADPDLGAAMQAQLQSDTLSVRPFLAKAGAEPFPRESFAEAIAHADFGIILHGGSSSASPRSRDMLHFLCGASVGGPGTERTVLVEPWDDDSGALSTLYGIPSIPYDQSAPLADSLDLICRRLQKGITELGSKK